MIDALLERGIDLVERGRVPDAVTRFAIRRLCAARLCQEEPGDPGLRAQRLEAMRARHRTGPIAASPEKPNEQHYELPAAFFERVLGPRMKYSACEFPTGTETLSEAEEIALDLVIERAGIEPGMRVLDLGCGWGSLTLAVAERMPSVEVTAVSNAKAQRERIEAACARRGLTRVVARTADVNELDPGEGAFDRVVSVEMVEHLRNHRLLFERVARWLRPGGKLFLHFFCHRRLAYPFVDAGAGDWMSRHFFTEGVMPSADFFSADPRPLALEDEWHLSGRHYALTAEAWLANLDARRADVRPILAATYGEAAADRWIERWRVFFMACAELFGFREGREWGVKHDLFVKPDTGG